MKKILIYYSLSGNGDIVANYLKNKGYEIRKVTTLEPLPKNRGLQIMTGGFKALINYCDKIDEINIDDYDRLIIASPIWNDRLSSPINTVIKNINKDEEIDFILYSGSGKANKACKRINKIFKKTKIIILKEPKKYHKELEKLDNY